MRALTPIQSRLLSWPGEDAQQLVFQHSTLCQCCLPYRDPGPAVTRWQRRNGAIHLVIQAGEVLVDAAADQWQTLGLPFGPKPRLVLCHLNAEALRTQTPIVHLEDSLTAFVRRMLGASGVNGRTLPV